MTPFGLINMGVLPLLLEAMAPAYAQHDPREQESRRPPQEQEHKPSQEESRGRPNRQERPPRPPDARPERQPQTVRPPHPEQPRPQAEPQRPPDVRPERPPPTVRPIPTVPPKHPTEPPRRPVDLPNRPPEARPVATPRAPAPEARPKPPQGRPPLEGRGRPEPRPQPSPQPNRPVQQAQREYANQHAGLWQEHRAGNWQAEHRTWQQRGGYSGYRIPEHRYRQAFGPSHGFRMFSYPLLTMGGYPRFQYEGMWFGVMDPWPEYWANDWYGQDDLYIEFYGGGYYLRNRRHFMDRIALTVYVN